MVRRFCGYRLLPLLFLPLLLAAPGFSASKEIIQIQRDIAILQVELRQIKSQTGERMAVLEELIKQNLEATSRLNQAIAVIERSVSKQGESLVKPVTSISNRVDSLASQFGALRDAVEALNSRASKLHQQMEDIKAHLTTLPPPSFEGEGGESGSVTSGETIFSGALTDLQRGNYDLARAQFQDYLREHPQTFLAAEAQYYLGDIAYQQEDFAGAVKNFDLVLERYPEGIKSPDAMYKKGLALIQLNKVSEATTELRNLVERYPNSNVAPIAQAKLEELEGTKPSPTRRSSR